MVSDTVGPYHRPINIYRSVVRTNGRCRSNSDGMKRADDDDDDDDDAR